MRFSGRCYLPLALTVVAGGCGAVRSQATTLGTDVIGAVREKEPELFELQRQLADSMGSFLGRAVEDKVLTRASGVWDTMLLRMNDQSRAVVGRLAEGVERDLNRSLQVTLTENLDLARASVGPLIDTTLASLEAGMRGRLRPLLIHLIAEAADSVSDRIESLDRKLSQSPTGKNVARVLYVLLGLLGVIVIGGGLAWRRSDVRTRRAFREVTARLQAAAPFQREAVQQDLRNKGFDRQADWLNQ